MSVVSLPRGGAADPDPDYVPEPPTPAADWEKELILSGDKPKRDLANVMHVLARHPAWNGVIGYDGFAESVVKLSPPPVRKQDAPSLTATGEWTEADSTRTAAWFAANVGFTPAVTMVDSAIVAIAEQHPVHPVRDWLSGLRWDRTDRAEHLFVDYFGAPDTAYVRAVGVRFLISAVARVFAPGCQADCMPVLEGEQGIRKSTGLEALAGKEWFSDSAIDIGSKDSYQSLRRKWIFELAELDSIRGREVTRVKAFISARVDSYRPSFGRKNRDFPRQVVFVGSTNESEYLADRTGNRRFWPVRCTRVRVDAIRQDRDQLWAEARHRYEAGEPWFLDSAELRRLAEAEQSDRVPDDTWKEIVATWLEAPTVPGADHREPIDPSEGITTSHVLLGALRYDPARINRAAETRAGQVLRALGYEPRRVRENGQRARRYFMAEVGPALTQDGCPIGEASTQPDSHVSLPGQPDPTCTHKEEVP